MTTPMTQPETPSSAPQVITSTKPPLWRDVRVLQWVFQLVVLAATVAILAWLYNNYRVNSEEQNIPTDLGFLDNPASFTIPGNSMSQSAPVRDAMVEGVLNTLRVSLVGVVLATILGTLIGIARLSKNWVLNKMAAAYVEAVRNIPLYIFLLYGNLVLVLGIFPRIEDAWAPLGLAVVSVRGLAVPWYEDGSAGGLILLLIVALAVGWVVSRSAPLGRRPDRRPGPQRPLGRARGAGHSRRRIPRARLFGDHTVGRRPPVDRWHPDRSVLLRPALRAGGLHGQPHR